MSCNYEKVTFILREISDILFDTQIGFDFKTLKDPLKNILDIIQDTTGEILENSYNKLKTI